MNVFDNPASPCCGGGYIFGSPWGIPDIATTLDAGANTITLQPNFNCYNGSDSFWSDGAGNGNKIMNANTYVEPGASFNGVDITFSGTVVSNDLDLSQYTAKYFIKALNPAAGFSDALGGSATFDLPMSGDFSVTVPGTSLPAGLIIQYGFVVDGINANPANAGALGSVVVSGATIEPCAPGQNTAACDNTVSSETAAADCECSGKLASISIRYVGADGQDFNVNSKKCSGLISAITGANTGDEFTINASDGGLSYFKNHTYFELVGSEYGSIKVPTNCHCNAQGQRFFPFEVIGWTDTEGNTCPIEPPCEDLTVSITTDNFGSETSFQLENMTTGTILLSAPTFSLPSGTTTVQSAGCVSVNDCYEMRIADSFGDGICCSWGAGNYSVSLGSTVVSSPTGGAFGSSEIVEIGSCGAAKSGSINEEDEDDKMSAGIENASLSTYPNPLENNSTFDFAIPATENVVLEVINMNGDKVGVLFSGVVEGGIAKKVNFDASELSSGIYFVQLTTPTQFLKEKIVIIK